MEGPIMPVPTPPSDLDGLGTMVREARIGRGLNQQEAGVLLGLTQGQISALETGNQTVVDAATLLALVRKLGLVEGDVIRAAAARVAAHRTEAA